MKWMLTAVFFGGSVLWGQSTTPDVNAPVQLQGSTLLWDQCGGEGDRACTPSDPAFVQLPQALVPVRCDITLDPVTANGVTICQDTGRRNNPAYRSRVTHLLDAQQTDQYAHIEADLPINYATILGTHNSFSNFKDGGNNRISVDQGLTMSEQLQLGARHVRIDPIVKADLSSVIVCHMSPTDTAWESRAFAYFGLKTIPNNAPEICGTQFNAPAPELCRGHLAMAGRFIWHCAKCGCGWITIRA